MQRQQRLAWSFVRNRCSSQTSGFESLESRRLLAVAVSSGVLTITGGGGNDTFVVDASGNNATVTENGGAARTFALSSFNSISASLGGGNDTMIVANAILKNSILRGEAGNDSIKGGGGNDTLDGGIGNDQLNGGSGGADTIDYSNRATPVTAYLHGRFENVAPYGDVFVLNGVGGVAGESDTYIDAEILNGGSGNDTLDVKGGLLTSNPSNLPATPTLRINGLGGNDRLNVQSLFGADGTPLAKLVEVADGGGGNDYFNITEGLAASTTVIGGDGDDHFIVNEILQAGRNSYSSATLNPGAGRDLYETTLKIVPTYTMPAGLEWLVARDARSIIGNGENNEIEVVSGVNATVDGLGGNDLIRAYDPATLRGGDGNDTVYGGNCADSIAGGAGNDLITAGNGDDSIDGGTGNDTISGDEGQDVTTYASRTMSVKADLALAYDYTNDRYGFRYLTLAGKVTVGSEVDTYTNIDGVIGGTVNDLISVAAPADITDLSSARGPFTFDGGGGDDRIYGSKIADRINGGGGNDSLDGGAGVDTIDGGDGNDTIFTGEGDDVVQTSSGSDAVDKLGGTGTLRVNFQPAGATPSGYVADTGLAFGTRGNGAQYGWSGNNTANTRRRGVNADARLDTLI